MRNTPNLKVEKFRAMGPIWRPLDTTVDDGNNGLFMVPKPKDDNEGLLRVIISDGEGWDHVSVSYHNRTPTWEEMQMVKELFFKDDETVIQYHPRKEIYINCHPYCLHMWRPQNIEIPTPPPHFVGPR